MERLSILISPLILAQQIVSYLNGAITQAQLVDWAESTLIDADFEEPHALVLADIVERLGLADVKEFRLQTADYLNFLQQLGYRVQYVLQAAA